jgi:opacity protein-like surface antigen
MKKLVSLVLLLGSISFSAQEISYGLKAGLNVANFSLSTDEMGDYDARMSFHVGAVLEWGITDKFAIQPELLYSSVGAKDEYTDEDVTIKTTAIVDYLSIPVMAKYYVADGFSLELGPQLGILLSAKGKYEASFDGETESETIDMKDNFESIDFGYAIGLSYSITNNIVGSVRYNLGTKNVIKNSEDKINNSAFQLSLGYNLF